MVTRLTMLDPDSVILLVIYWSRQRIAPAADFNFAPYLIFSEGKREIHTFLERSDKLLCLFFRRGEQSVNGGGHSPPPPVKMN